ALEGYDPDPSIKAAPLHKKPKNKARSNKEGGHGRADIRGKDNRHTPRNKNSRNQKESETGEIKQNKSKPARRSRKHDDDRDNQNPWSKARKEF
ncbi:ATP-dependent RNA helicase RhlE, partial [Proteus mirabilis]